jgi:hypothetical protein
MMHKVTESLSVIGLLLIAGCTAIDRSPYPGKWMTAVKLDNGCRDINGMYKSSAGLETYQHPQKDVLLALTLLPADASLRFARSVSLEIAKDKTLHVVAYADDGSVLSRQSYSPDANIYGCDDGKLVFRPSNMPETKQAADNPLVGVSWEEVVFQRTGDGSLVMQVSSGATGMAFLVVPVYVESQHWYLFRRIGSVK